MNIKCCETCPYLIPDEISDLRGCDHIASPDANLISLMRDCPKTYLFDIYIREFCGEHVTLLIYLADSGKGASAVQGLEYNINATGRDLLEALVGWGQKATQTDVSGLAPARVEYWIECQEHLVRERTAHRRD